MLADPGARPDRRGAGRRAERAPSLQPDAAVAVLLADVPALRGADLTPALAAAGQHPSAVVPDLDGTGTVLLTAGPHTALRHAFGPGSAARHRDLGAVVLDLDLPRLRRDVDTARTCARPRGSASGPGDRAALLPADWH